MITEQRFLNYMEQRPDPLHDEPLSRLMSLLAESWHPEEGEKVRHLRMTGPQRRRLIYKAHSRKTHEHIGDRPCGICKPEPLHVFMDEMKAAPAPHDWIPKKGR